MQKELKPWSVTASRVTFEDRWIKLRSDDCLTDTGTVIAPYHVLEYPDWVSVVPVMADGTVMLVEEYRHGRGAVMAGLVSGGVEAADRLTDDPALSAARRELREETGYDARVFVKVLTSYPNSASHSNIVTCYLAFGLGKAGEQQLDPNEEISVFFVDLPDLIHDLTTGGRIMQAMHAAGLYASMNWLLTQCPDDAETILLRDALRLRFFGVGVDQA